MITKFYKYVNENIKDLLSGKSDEDVEKGLNDIENPFVRYETIINEDLPLKYLPTNKEMLDNLKDEPNTIKIHYIIKYNLGFENLPRNIFDRCINKGNLYLPRFIIKKLPDNLTVKGDLNVDNNNLTELPKGLRVNGILSCNNNKLSKLPDDLYVGKYTSCYGNLVSQDELISNTKAKVNKNYFD